ncbi:chloride channel protein [Heterostelium album PN500]|uniref:Chloride channel protein n=1 Tax=Heterostelium pallidum (strain ATCC 26659 / Pp 5 / PN500) TaxID=670386 RepID=D3BBK0_HETP5|nr:chloride channel protein [Heterostelium album PN500]EFA81033.1 chloride channel protein [Heterostelium album PN500]|eukprot:XP_020433151.1 chloride channel protein [Heterostelium album PN500]
MGGSLNRPMVNDAYNNGNDGFYNASPQTQTPVTHRRRSHHLTPYEIRMMKNVQSLDFTVNDNLLLREDLENKTRIKHLKKTLGINLLYATISILLVIVAGPMASSSGIPEVKGYLNGVKVPNSLGFKSLFGKIFSLIMSYSSGLFVGPEGPMIHIGSAIGAAVSQFRSSTFEFYPKLFLQYQNDRDKRDFISVGAASGISAAFGAPIGGVLFSIEEASSFWSRQLTWRTFFCCMIATFTTNFLLQGFGTSPDMHDTGLLTFGFSRLYLYRYSELLCFCILGVLGGAFGALFVFLNIHLNKWRRDYLKKNISLRSIEAIVVMVITSVICFYSPSIFPCRYQSNIQVEPSVCEDQTNAQMEQFFCPPGMYSEMASLLFVNPDLALRRLYSRTNNSFTLGVLLVFTCIYFFLSVITSGLWVAGGLFVPMMMVGAGFGRFVGQVVGLWFEGIDASIYALVGTAAMMAGYCRMTISLVVIMVELTEGTQYLVPIILAVMIAKWVGDFFNESIFYRGQNGEIILDDNFRHQKFIEETSKKVPKLEDFDFNKYEEEKLVDLRPYMNSSSITIHDTFSFSECYKLFRTMGLRHLTVI